MRKLLFALIAMWISFSASAVDYYLIGGFNGWTSSDSRCKFTAGSNGVYTLDLPNGLPLTSGFKINDGGWNNANANFGGSAALTLGVTYNLTASSSSGNINFADASLTVPNAHLEFNPSAKTLVVTGAAQSAQTLYGIHGNIFGDTNWSTEVMTETNGNWVLSDKTIVAGQFGVKTINSLTNAQIDWYSTNNTTDATIVVGKGVNLVKDGNTNFSIAAGTYTFTINPTSNVLTVTGTSTGEAPEVDEYANWWVNIGGEFNSNNFFDGGVQPVDKVATFTNQAIGNKGFKIKTWDGSEDQYYIADGESTIPTGQWVQFAIDAFDAQAYIKDAPADGVYTVQYNVETNQIYLTQTGGSTTQPEEPSYPENMYIIGTIDGEGWNPTLGKLMTDEGEGIYTIEDVVIKEVSGNTGFSFVTALAENNDDGGWTYINGLRYGPKINDTEVTLDQELPFEKVANSWTIKPGTYNFTLDFNDMILYVEGEAAGTEPGPDIELVPFDAMFNFGSYEGLAECVPGLPAESSWTADGTTGNTFTTALPAEVDGVVVKPIAHSSATASNTPRYYKTAAGAYALRIYNNNTMTISAPEGGYLSSIVLTSTSTSSAVQKISADAGSISFNDKVATWTPTARANINSVTFSLTGTIIYSGIEVTGEAPEVDEPDVPTPEVPETTWNVNGNYNDDSSWSTPIKFTSYDNGVYSTDKINKLVEFKLTNEGTWYGYDGEGYAELGKTFKVASGDQYGNVAFGLSGYVQDAVISFNPTTLDVTVTGTWVSTALELYVRGDINNWGNDGLTDADKLTTTDGNVYTITLPELPAGSAFKIAAESWSPEYTTNNTAMENGTYDIVSGNNMALGKSMTNVTLTLDIAKKTLTVAGTESGATTLYLYGSMNEWTKSDDWKFETEDGENYTLEGVTIPAEATMKISDAGWNSNFTYSYTGEDGILLNVKYTLENLTGDNENMYLSHEATDATVNYNINTHAFEIVVAVPEAPDAFYMISEANGWGEGVKMEYIKDEPNFNGQKQYVYELSGLTLNNPLSFALSEEANAWVNKYGCAANGEFTEATTLEAKPEGGNFINATNLTNITLTFYYNPIGKSWLQLSGEEAPADLQLTFVGVNFNIEGEDINDLLTLQDNGALISTGGEDMGIINITSNPFNFVPNTGMGAYMLNLTHKEGYLLTASVAPATPDDAQIVVQDGDGNVMIQGRDLGDNIGVIVTITKETEPGVLYLAQPFNTIPAVDPQSIEETEPGVYEGVFKFKTGMSYIGFYTVDGDVITKYSKGGFGTFPADPAAYPLTDDLVENPSGNFSWYIPSLPAGCQGNYNVTVNLNDLTITVDPIYEEAPAPDNLYLWGSTNGGVRAVKMADFVKNGNVYILEDYEISSYGIFDTSDSEGGSTIDRGFSFFLCDNGTSFTAAGASRYYGPKATSEDEPDPAIIDLTTANNTYTATTTKNGAADMGGNFIAINPGVYTLTFNYETKEFTAVLDEAYKQVTFEFVGEGNIADPRTYVEAINMSAAEPETLDLYTNTKLFSYNDPAGVLFALKEGFSEDYTLTVTGPTGIEAGETTYMIDGSTTEGIVNEMVTLIGVDNVTFTVTVGEIVDNNAYLGIAQGQVPTAPNKEFALTPDATGYVYTGTFTIQPGQSFNFWYPSNILLGDENEDGENVKYQPMGPASGEEILINFNSVHNIFEDGVDVNMTGYWTLDSDQPLELTVTVDMTTRSIEVLNNTELPALNALVFDDWTMYLKEEETTAEVPLYLDMDETISYSGVQFQFTLPVGIEFKSIEFNDAIKVAGAPAVNTDDKLYGAPNTTAVLAYFTEPTSITEDIATITVASKTGDIEAGTYDVDLKVVIFSNASGSGDIVLPDYTGKVTIEFAEVPATDVEITKVTLNEPSYTSSIENVTEVTQGESVDVTVVVTPENSTDVVKVTADNGATVTKNEDGTWTVDTSGVEVEEGEEVTVTITATAREGVEDTYTITVKGILLGDSNANGKVTVADVVTTANYIVEKPINNFCWPNANVITNDEDAPGARNGISVQDVTATVNIVLDIFDGNRAPQNIRRRANRYASNDRLVADNFHAGNNTIGISLENNAQYAALQATIEIPAGMKVYEVTAGPRAASHELVYNVVDGKLNVILFSYTNDTFANGEGSLFNISVSADENCGDLVMTNILASDLVSNGYELAAEGGLYSEATGIDGIGAEGADVRYFTVDGIEVFNPEKGQILIRVEGNKAEKVLVK